MDPFFTKSVKVSLKGQEIEGLAADHANNSFRDEFFRLYYLTNQDQGKNACSISFKQFKENACILVYNFISTFNETHKPLLSRQKGAHKGRGGI